MLGWNSISIGNNSSLPASMSNISTHLQGVLKNWKFSVGPTRSRPGPILLIVAATDVNVVTKS